MAEKDLVHIMPIIIAQSAYHTYLIHFRCTKSAFVTLFAAADSNIPMFLDIYLIGSYQMSIMYGVLSLAVCEHFCYATQGHGKHGKVGLQYAIFLVFFVFGN